MGICFERQDYITSQVQQSGRLVFTLGKYQFVALGGLIINWPLLYVFTTIFNVFYIISGLAATIVVDLIS